MKRIRLHPFLFFALTPIFLLLATFILNSPSTFAQDDTVVLSGRVTADGSGDPVSGVRIRLLDPGYPGVWDVGITDSSGYYTVTTAINEGFPNLLPGTYLVLFQSSGTYISEYYDNIDTHHPNNAAQLHLSVDDPKTEINAQLVQGGAVHGTIVGQDDNQGKPWREVYFYDLDGDLVTSYSTLDTTSFYTATGVPPGTYKIRAEPSGSEDFLASAYYPDALTFEEAEAVEVSAGELITGVNFSLVVGGRISQTLISDTPGAQVVRGVEVYDKAGKLFTNWRPGGLDTIRNLPPGSYRLRFFDKAEQHRPEFYDNKQTLETATPISVTAGAVISFQVELAHIPRVNAIATVKELPGTILLAFDYNPVPVFTNNNGQSWWEIASAPWASQDPYRSPAIGLVPRAEPGLSQRLLVMPTGFDAKASGIYRTGDNGQIWSKATYPVNQCKSEDFSHITASLFNPAQLYTIYTCLNNVLGDLLGYSTLLVSRDAGLTWQKAAASQASVASTSSRAPSIMASPVIADRLYYYSTGKLQQSDDGGAHWIEKEFPASELALDAADADWLYGVQYWDEQGTPRHRGQRSEDGGGSWAEWAQDPCLPPKDPYTGRANFQVVAHPTQGKMIFLRCDQGLYRSTNGGDNWTQLDPAPGQLLAPDYVTPGRIFWAKDDGLWVSTDNGDSWQAIMDNYQLTTAADLNPIYLPSISTKQ